MNPKYDASFYIRVLDQYVATGECSDTDDEPLYAYLLSIMNDPMIKIQVLTDEVCARIFYDMMSQFIHLNLEKEKYNLQKSQSEQNGMKQTLEWSIARRKDGWQALLQQVSDKYETMGFGSSFYRSQFGNEEEKYGDDELWERMVEDWEEAFKRNLQEQKKKEIDQRKESLENRLHANLKNIPEYLRRHEVGKDEFFQAWGLMSGMWNTVDFERIRKVVRMQKEYPELAIDGEMQVNFAMNRELRDAKYPFTRLKGKDVNTLIFPNLSSANAGYKLLQAMDPDTEFIGPIQMGLNKPIHFTDFESSVRDIVNITAVAVIDAIVVKKKNESR